jgi:hypothetical protein
MAHLDPLPPSLRSLLLDWTNLSVVFPHPSWVEQLPSSLEKHGLQLETYDKIPMKPTYRTVWNQSNLAGLEDLAGDSTVVGVEKAEEIRAWIGALSAEFAQGVSFDTPFLCVVRRKPF